MDIRRGLAELKRRKVYHVAVAYVVAAFAVWQVADIAFPSLGLPDTAVTLVLALTLLGFPLAMVLAWAYEVRPEQPAADPESQTLPTGRPRRTLYRSPTFEVSRASRCSRSRTWQHRTEASTSLTE